MTAAPSRLHPSRLQWSEIETIGPWQCALLPVPEFPLQAAYATAVERFFFSLGSLLTGAQKLNHQILLQTWKLGPETGTPTLSAHRKAWRAQLGLGIWPDRNPPQGWTEERMMDAAAAAFRGDEPELPSHRLLRLRLSPAESPLAARTMRRFGVMIEIFFRGEVSQLDTRCREMFHPRIEEDQFLHEEFYCPVLDRNSVLSAKSAEEMDSFLCGADVYVRDSAEDRGILMVSRLPIRSLFEQTQLRLESS